MTSARKAPISGAMTFWSQLISPSTRSLFKCSMRKRRMRMAPPTRAFHMNVYPAVGVIRPGRRGANVRDRGRPRRAPLGARGDVRAGARAGPQRRDEVPRRPGDLALEHEVAADELRRIAVDVDRGVGVGAGVVIHVFVDGVHVAVI